MEEPQRHAADIKKKRRQTAFYPNVNSTNKIEKPFSKSAAKRDSVLALGSIEHLQHYFTKTGLTTTKRPRKNLKGLVPALGPGVLNVSPPPNIPLLTFDLPPSPVMPSNNHMPHFPPATPSPYTVDPESLKPGVIQDLEGVQNIWLLSDSGPSNSLQLPGKSAGEFDVLAVLKTTTRAIRSVRNYCLALPDDHPSHHYRSTLMESYRHHSSARPNYASMRAGSSASTFTSTSARVPLANQPILPPPSPASNAPDPLALIRRSALDVLTVLRELEERSRIPISDEMYDAMSMGSGISRTQSPLGFVDRTATASPSVLSGDEDGGLSDTGSRNGSRFSAPASPGRRASSRQPRPEIIPLTIPGRNKEVSVWNDESEDDDDEFEDEESKRDAWDDRLVLGGGFLYRNDIDPASLTHERKAIGRYLDVVDEVLFGNSITGIPGQRGWTRAKDEPPASGPGARPRPRMSLAKDGGSSPRKTSERRLVSPSLLEAMSELVLTTEPESIGGSMNPLAEEGEEYESDSVPDEDLPDWAKRSRFIGDPYGRLHSILINHLPVEMLGFLPISMDTSTPATPATPSPNPSSTDPPTPQSPPVNATAKDALLSVLSDGQILCTAYNIIVRKSSKPWGYIHLENVHDLLGLTQPKKSQEDPGATPGPSKKNKASWTFRRTENLRYWAAALKLRYLIAITYRHPNAPHHPRRLHPTSPPVSSMRNPPERHLTLPDPAVSPFLYFDPKIVAGRESGWEKMFEALLMRWLEAILLEIRQED